MLDAGALVALERVDPAMWARYELQGRDGVPPVTQLTTATTCA
ncbi:hypothetical protein [Euzebya sp.]